MFDKFVRELCFQQVYFPISIQHLFKNISLNEGSFARYEGISVSPTHHIIVNERFRELPETKLCVREVPFVSRFSAYFFETFEIDQYWKKR